MNKDQEIQVLKSKIRSAHAHGFTARATSLQLKLDQLEPPKKTEKKAAPKKETAKKTAAKKAPAKKTAAKKS